MATLEIPRRNILHNISYLEYNPAGEQVIVFLHGLGATSKSWMLQAPELTGQNYRVLCPDIPGFGKSPWNGKTWSVKSAATRLSEFLRTAAPEGYHLAGLSMGGVIAQFLAVYHPEPIKKLILVNTFARLGVGKPGQWIYYLKRYYLVALYGLKPQAEMVARRIFPSDDQEIYRKVLIEEILEGDDKTYLQALRSLGLVNLQRQINRIRKETLVISGADDTTVPLANQLLMRVISREPNI